MQISITALHEAMKSCEQTKGMSVLQHGESVKSYLFDLLEHLRNNKPLKYEWRLPDWIYSEKDYILSKLPNDSTLSLYTKYHDCGKPFCLEIDSEGKRHFPKHAEKSYEIFKEVFKNEVSAELVKHDMDIHLLKSEGVDDFCKNPNAIALLITGLSEIHSNSIMFGGLESSSFKIKWKNLNQRGKKIINNIKTQK